MIPKEDENSDISNKDQDSFKFIKQALNNLLMDENNQTKKPALLEIEGNEKETSNRNEFDSRFINEIAVKENGTFEVVENNEMNNKHSSSLTKAIDYHEEDGNLSGQKPFKCEFCDAVFTRNDNLKRHISSIHEEKKPSYQCQICNFCFTQKSKLNTHIRLIHEE